MLCWVSTFRLSTLQKTRKWGSHTLSTFKLLFTGLFMHLLLIKAIGDDDCEIMDRQFNLQYVCRIVYYTCRANLKENGTDFLTCCYSLHSLRVSGDEEESSQYDKNDLNTLVWKEIWISSSFQFNCTNSGVSIVINIHFPCR